MHVPQDAPLGRRQVARVHKPEQYGGGPLHEHGAAIRTQLVARAGRREGQQSCFLCVRRANGGRGVSLDPSHIPSRPTPSPGDSGVLLRPPRRHTAARPHAPPPRGKQPAHPQCGAPPPPPPAIQPRRGPQPTQTKPPEGTHPTGRQGSTGPGQPPPTVGRRSKGHEQERRGGTHHMERPYWCATRGPREVRAQQGRKGCERRGSGSAQLRKGDAPRTRRATGPSSQNAQITWNVVPTGEDKGHRDGPARYRQRGGREADGEKNKHQHRPGHPQLAASAANTQAGQCTSQGSSGAAYYAPAPQLGSLRASPPGSHWQQASSTGPSAPAPRATKHEGDDVVGKRPPTG